LRPLNLISAAQQFCRDERGDTLVKYTVLLVILLVPVVAIIMSVVCWIRASADCRLVGRCPIVEADLWDRDHLDLCGPATLTIIAQFALGALEAGLEGRIRPRLDGLPLGRMR